MTGQVTGLDVHWVAAHLTAWGLFPKIENDTTIRCVCPWHWRTDQPEVLNATITVDDGLRATCHAGDSRAHDIVLVTYVSELLVKYAEGEIHG